MKNEADISNWGCNVEEGCGGRGLLCVTAKFTSIEFLELFKLLITIRFPRVKVKDKKRMQVASPRNRTGSFVKLGLAIAIVLITLYLKRLKYLLTTSFPLKRNCTDYTEWDSCWIQRGAEIKGQRNGPVEANFSKAQVIHSQVLAAVCKLYPGRLIEFSGCNYINRVELRK